MSLLPGDGAVLLDLPLRLRHLSVLHGKKFLGNVLQRHHMAMPGLRGVERIRESVGATPCGCPLLKFRPAAHFSTSEAENIYVESELV